MSFGLHLGWAIEAAMGSYFKIDVSYMSPNVINTSKLQKATQYYSLPLLITGQLYDNFGSETQGLCRQIDRTTLKESEDVLNIYTCDLLSCFIE